MSAVEVMPFARLGLRFLGSEIGMQLRRRRNQLMLVVLAAIPIVIGVAVKLTSQTVTTGGIIGGITNNGVFIAFTGLVVVVPLFLPMAVAVVVGESVAGEANLGTLRYLLAVPVGRGRLLTVKFVAAAVWCLVITSVVGLAGLVTGLVLFPSSRVTLLSGTQTDLAGGFGRVLVMVGYAALMMVAVAAIGLFVSTLTEVPIAAMATTLAVAIVMQVLVAVPQLHAIRPWLITNSCLSFADMFRDPLEFGGLRHGVLLALAYVVVFSALSWARFTTKDVSS